MTADTATALSLCAAFGPVLIAVVLSFEWRKGWAAGLRGLMMPFDTAPAWTSALHIVLGLAFCVWPVYAACRAAMSPERDRFFLI